MRTGAAVRVSAVWVTVCESSIFRPPGAASLGAGMDLRPVQREDAEGPDHPREVQHLQIRRLQGSRHRSADACHARERRDASHRGRDEGRPSRALKKSFAVVAEKGAAGCRTPLKGDYIFYVTRTTAMVTYREGALSACDVRTSWARGSSGEV